MIKMGLDFWINVIEELDTKVIQLQEDVKDLRKEIEYLQQDKITHGDN